MDTLSVITNNVVSLYKEPNSSSEMLTQAIMGQPVWIEREAGEWSYIRMCDNYHGWVRSKWIKPCEQPHTQKKAVVVRSLIADVFSGPQKSSEIITKVVITTELEVAGRGDEWIKVRLPDEREAFINHLDVASINKAAGKVILPDGARLVATAKRFIGVPYLWGGVTPFGLDCSGFVQLVYRIHGLVLPRDSCMQAVDERAVPVAPKQLKAGDLIFFAGGSDRDGITHVGMAIGDGRFIHASGGGAGVIVSSLDEPRYQEIYWGCRRINLGTEERKHRK